MSTTYRRFWRAIATIVVAVVVCASLAPVATPKVSAADVGEIAPGRVIVKMRGRSAAAARESAATYGALAVEDRPSLDAQLWHVQPGSEADVARRLGARSDVEYAEPDRILRFSLVPNDTYFGGLQWNLPKINAPAAWDVTAGDPGVTVAVIDSGFDVTHPDRPASLRLGCDYVVWGNRSQPCPTVSGDANGHGTHVSGIIAARQNNAIGISGLAPNVTLLAIRTADASGSSYLSDVSSAIREATNSGARVINMSLGGPGYSSSQASAVNYAISRGVVVVAAAGNEYDSGNPTSYPAAYPGVIAVGSASVDDQHAYFSNTGSYVSIVAPGGSATSSSDGDSTHWIVSLYPVAKGAYQMIEGTSQASPHVAAVAGLMFSARPSLSGSRVASLLKSTARPIGAVPNDTFGYGYLDANAAVRAAQQDGVAPTSTPTFTPTAIPTSTHVPTATPIPTATPVPPAPSRPAPAPQVSAPTPVPTPPAAVPTATAVPANPPAARYRVLIPGVSRAVAGL